MAAWPGGCCRRVVILRATMRAAASERASSDAKPRVACHVTINPDDGGAPPCGCGVRPRRSKDGGAYDGVEQGGPAS